MTKTLLSGVAAIAFTLSAPMAFAQDADPETEVEMAAEETMHATDEAMDDMADEAEDAAEDMEDMADDAAEEMEDMADDAMEDADAVTEDAEDAAEGAMAAEPVETVTVSCPEGTDAQDDGSCMVTGDWSPEE